MGAFFLLRINDHLQYLKKTKSTLDGAGDFQGTDHHSCKLGVWMDTLGPQESIEVGPQAGAVFNAIHVPHEQFHSASERALSLKSAGSNREREKAITEMHQLSGALVDLLLQLDSLASGKR